MSDQSPESVSNLALDKLGADPVASISAPLKPNEKLLARLYPQTRDAELSRHRWLFSMRVDRLTPSGSPIVNDIDGTLYRFIMPGDALRPVRTKGTTWVRRGRELLDPSSTYIDVMLVVQKLPSEWDPLFLEAVACKLAETVCEKITQSTDKKQDLKDDYKKAIDEAKHANALILGADDVIGSDDNYSWLTARLG